MAIKYYCPKCDKKDAAILYGKVNLRKRGLTSRIFCKSCGETTLLPRPPEFFSKMRTPDETIHKALKSYIEGKSIQSIADELKKEPNTIIKWVKKVYKFPLKYKEVLKALDKPENDIIKFFKDLRDIAMHRKTSEPYGTLVKNINAILRHYNEPGVTHPDYFSEKHKPFLPDYEDAISDTSDAKI